MFLIRILFILALFANIGVYIYMRQHTPQQQKSFQAVDSGVEKLVLLSELDIDNTIWEKQEAPENTDSEPEIFNQECFSVGAFNAKSEVSPIIDAIKNDVIKLRTRKIISTQEAGYWVYIPAKNSREEALKLGRQLSEYDIKDYYVVTGGENENTLSLGLYRDRRNADARLQELLSKGFNAKKQVKVEQWPEFWLDYTIASDQLENIVDISQINPDVASNQVECNW